MDRCAICGESRVLESCHILARRRGGSDREVNLIKLCPTHHKLFDRELLNKDEEMALSCILSLRFSEVSSCDKFVKEGLSACKGCFYSTEEQYSYCSLILDILIEHEDDAFYDHWFKKVLA